jgi:hypothetical protein
VDAQTAIEKRRSLDFHEGWPSRLIEESNKCRLPIDRLTRVARARARAGGGEVSLPCRQDRIRATRYGIGAGDAGLPIFPVTGEGDQISGTHTYRVREIGVTILKV